MSSKIITIATTAIKRGFLNWILYNLFSVILLSLTLFRLSVCVCVRARACLDRRHRIKNVSNYAYDIELNTRNVCQLTISTDGHFVLEFTAVLSSRSDYDNRLYLFLLSSLFLTKISIRSGMIHKIFVQIHRIYIDIHKYHVANENANTKICI